MTHPYEGLPQGAYWRTGVTEPGAFGLSGLWQPKFPVRPADSIFTAGSCFAQHIGQALLKRGYGWTDFEPAPPFLEGPDARRFNYGVFSFRTGNIYTPGMLLQWLQIAFGDLPQPHETWQADGRFFDPLRPAIEPDGFVSEAELMQAREATCAAIREAVCKADLFVFTLGLTESWFNSDTGLEYALCPGTAAGRFDERVHRFRNANSRLTYRNTRAAINLMQSHNPDLRVLLTVSPVPLTATASGDHVLVATTYSKSILRGAAGMLADEMAAVDYFPSYEIITHPVFRGMFYAANMRSVVPEGVDTVMGHFFGEQQRAFGKPGKKRGKRGAKPAPGRPGAADAFGDLKCEEEMLDAFAS